MLKSPFNYVGGKFKLMPQLINLFPPKQVVDRFFDVFCGGFTVGINYHYKIIAVDNSPQLIQLLQYLQSHSICHVLITLDKLVNSYKLSKTNSDGYINLKRDYNKNKHPLYLYALICHSFNHQIRFNNKLEFNMPFGKNRSHFNKKVKQNLILFMESLHCKDVDFKCCDFSEIKNFQEGDFVYCDPPYKITLACYNEKWNQHCDDKLFKFLDKLNEKGVLFGLSNVTKHGNAVNNKLETWANKYKKHTILSNYKNCNYHKKEKTPSHEVYITNYLL